MPVSGRVVDTYVVDGRFHSCNPGPVVALATPFSKNRRHVTIVDTDVDGGTGVGHCAIIEVVALMIGDIASCYSTTRYDDPHPLEPGMFVRRGQPKALYRPGSSTDLLLIEDGRLRFEERLVANARRTDVASRYSLGFGQPLVETDVLVRALIGRAVESPEDR
jgi:phosphatidylserine decarboxylase